MKLLFVYILECADRTYYTGITNNLDRRIKEHETGKNPEAYTFSRRPVALKFYAEFTDFYLAIDKEKQIKRWSNAKKKALIEGKFDLLRNLSKKKF
jgi:putative endonuclease